MPTIKEIATECGVSVQAIRAWCRRNQIAKDAKGRWKLDESALSQIYGYYQVNKLEDSESKSETVCASSESKLSDMLQAEVEYLRSQIEIKDRQIVDLSTALLNAQKEASAAQQLHGVEKVEKVLESTQQKIERKTRWQRLKEAWYG